MNYLSVESVARRFGDRTLFEGVSFGINQGQKVGLVAPNGAGKSSLLKIIAGSEEPDEGQVVFRKEIRVGYLDQDDSFDPKNTVLDAIFDADDPVQKVVNAYEKALAHPEDEEAYQAAFDAMDRLNAWDYEVKAKQVLGKLKFFELDQHVSTLSGGQKKRLALARVLLQEPDFLILDEPTNHLDLEMIEWLENYLAKSNMTLFMVTHDRYFLEVVCDDLIELAPPDIFRYQGNYAYYLEKKAEREANEAASIGKARNLMRKELEWIRRQPKARGTKSKARVDAFGDLKKRASKKIENKKPEFEINITRLGTKILELIKVEKSFGDQVMLDNFTYTFARGEKVGIVGGNGVGKSTFLNLVMGELPVDGGKVIVGETVVFGYYRQDNLKFREDQKVIDIVRDIADFVPLKGGKTITATQLLERFAFKPEQHHQFVEKLSGGERRKLFLLTILMHNPNFLILDEPTNDLDIKTLTILEEYLLSFPGCVLVVSHDRYFMDKIVDHIFAFTGEGKVKDFPGNYSQYRIWADEQKKEANRPKKEIKVEREKAPSQKLSYKEKRELEQLEKDIDELEGKRDALNGKLMEGTVPPNEINEQYKVLGLLEKDIEDKTLRWMELGERL